LTRLTGAIGSDSPVSPVNLVKKTGFNMPASHNHTSTVIVVSYNARDLLRDCLKSVLGTEHKAQVEVIVVDNASRDGAANMVREEFPRVKLIASDVNLGFAAANNLAYEHASGDVIFLFNPDARLKSGSLDAMHAFLDTHPECGLAGGLIRNPDGGLEPSARKFPGVLNKFFILSGLSDRFPRLFGGADYKAFAHDRPLPVDWVPGTFTAIRRSMLEEIGFFDDRFFMYYEETDLCLRASQAGWKTYFVPGAEIEHEGGGCSKTRDDMEFDTGGAQLVGYRMRSEALYYRKNFGALKALAALWVEGAWHLLRILANPGDSDEKRGKRAYSKMIVRNIRAALRDTRNGRVSPPAPW
jgi:N-acetylglucosaminyl-diphospho-decaprenol L-rhamnosyltransferase